MRGTTPTLRCEAERALKFDPDNPEAKRVRAAAKETQEKIAAAVAGVKSGADDAQRANAYWELFEMAPDHPATDEIPAALDAGFRPRADEARRLMAEAQRAAAQASRAEAFADGTKLAREAETSYKAGAYARAARDFMRARERFRRAR